MQARGYWLVEPGHDGGRGELRPADLPEPGPDEVLVRTLWTGISRGTEGLVHRGEVPPDQYDAMRGPHQRGDLPAPVQYGYLAVGVVEQGPDPLVGRTVFCLHPHQDAFVVPATAVHALPGGVPARRAVLTGLVETAVNALWDVPPVVGSRVAVVGAGTLGCCVARLVAGIPGTQVTLVDVRPERQVVAEALGARFTGPDDAPGGLDLVVHTSATAAGLQRSLDLLAPEGTVVELSWYGTRQVPLALGGAFHSRRLQVRGSQVGTVAPGQAPRRSTRDRLALALELLRDPAYDALLTATSPFEELPAVLPRIAAGALDGLCHTISYEGGHPEGGPG